MNGSDATTERWAASRRRFLGRAALLSGGLGAAFLAACGGGSKEAAQATVAPGGGAATTAAGASSASAATNETPKRGGRFTITASASATNNIYAEFVQGTSLDAVHVYDRLFIARNEQPNALEAAESLEQPDPLTVVAKLKPGLKYQNLPPVNGRAVEAEDIVQDKLYIKDFTRAYQNSFERDFLEKVEATDARTVVFKLKSPNAYLLGSSMMGSSTSGAIVPKELLPNLDTIDPVGSGPFQRADTVKDARYLYKRNDGWREQGKPYFDERAVTILTDQAAIEAAFRSGQIDYWLAPNSATAKRIERDLGAKVKTGRYLAFTLNNFNTNPTRAPWTDIRVREALYRIINRKQALDLIENGDGVLPYGILSASLKDYQLAEEETRKYWKNDPAEGKKLLEAAGFDFSKTYRFVSNNNAASPQSQRAQIFAEQLSQVGIKTKLDHLPLAEWFPIIQRTGDFDLNCDPGPGFETPQQALRYHHTRTNFVVAFAGGRDPKLDAMIEKQEQTLDVNERKKQIRDVQFAALDFYTGCALSYTQYAYQLYQPWLKNFEVTPYVSLQPIQRRETWIDK